MKIVSVLGNKLSGERKSFVENRNSNSQIEKPELKRKIKVFRRETDRRRDLWPGLDLKPSKGKEDITGSTSHGSLTGYLLYVV